MRLLNGVDKSTSWKELFYAKVTNY